MPRTIWRVTEDKSVDQDGTTEQALWKSQVAEVVVKASSTHKHHIWTRRSATAATPDQALYIKDNESLRRLVFGWMWRRSQERTVLVLAGWSALAQTKNLLGHDVALNILLFQLPKVTSWLILFYLSKHPHHPCLCKKAPKWLLIGIFPNKKRKLKLSQPRWMIEITIFIEIIV